MSFPTCVGRICGLSRSVFCIYPSIVVVPFYTRTSVILECLFVHGVWWNFWVFPGPTGEEWRRRVELMYILLSDSEHLCLCFKGHLSFFSVNYLYPLLIFFLIFKELLEGGTIRSMHRKNFPAFHLPFDFTMFLPGKKFKFTCSGIYFKTIFMAYRFSVIKSS